MKKIISLLVLVLAASAQVRADTVSDLISLGMKPELAELIASLSTVKSNAAWFQARNQAGNADINVIRVDATDDTQVNADSGDLIKFSVAATPVAALGASAVAAAWTPSAAGDLVLNGKITAVDTATLGGISLPAAKQMQQLPAVLTPSTDFTPVATGVMSGFYSRAVSGSPTRAAVFLPAATPNTGKMFYLQNEGSNPVEIYPSLADKINAGGANTPVSVAAGKLEKCVALKTDTYTCTLEN